MFSGISILRFITVSFLAIRLIIILLHFIINILFNTIETSLLFSWQTLMSTEMLTRLLRKMRYMLKNDFSVLLIPKSAVYFRTIAAFIR